jgi:hypothetical protein
MFKKNRYYEIVHWVLDSIHWTLILVALRFNIPSSDCRRAGSASVMVVVCESDNGVFEAGGRSKARDTETSDDKGLRDALQILSTCSGQES